ncbi:tetraspanin Pls1 family [Athelia psychrophila]|uniref:Tetraspanin Pls1 family n=1 Tax=Athelia psychrophila TaxID=1759441 RepID=A0A166M779_9AGAM|nr:tetraspanin Pls1 family [Fibularhizoctonia sp. CBS 109695]
MVSKSLMGAWAFFDFTLLAAGIVSLVLSFVWRKPDLLLNLAITDADLTAGMILGIFLIATFFLSIGAILQRNQVTFGLILLNWMLVLDALVVLVVGTFIWFFTLAEENNFHARFSEQSAANRIGIQDKLNCCGYFNLTDLVEIGGNACSSQEAVTALNTTCVLPIITFADTTLNDTFTTIYGFMAVVVCLFMASLCVIKKRNEDERFKRIDAKRGGSGFV